MTIAGEAEMKQLGEKLGKLLGGGEVFELIGDVGAGKTTFTKGLAVGMKIDEVIQSPTFTISRVYTTPSGLELRHYDFYRLNEAGIMASELAESIDQPDVVTIVEWAKAVESVLSSDRIRVAISATSDEERQVEITAQGSRSARILEELV